MFWSHSFRPLFPFRFFDVILQSQPTWSILPLTIKPGWDEDVQDLASLAVGNNAKATRIDNYTCS